MIVQLEKGLARANPFLLRNEDMTSLGYTRQVTSYFVLRYGCCHTNFRSIRSCHSEGSEESENQILLFAQDDQ